VAVAGSLTAGAGARFACSRARVAETAVSGSDPGHGQRPRFIDAGVTTGVRAAGRRRFGAYGAVMARPLRIQASGATYHVTANATYGRKLFVENDDRRWFEYRLEDVVRRCEWSCKAHCLLGTHYHILVTTPEANLADGMQRLNGMHAQATNDRHEQYGALFRDRYHTELVEREGHFLELFRYIALNPVRAGLCKHPAHWRWSSYPAAIGWASPQPFLDLESVLQLFGRDPAVARSRLQAFVEDGLAASCSDSSGV
jgi:putative transposase